MTTTVIAAVNDDGNNMTMTMTITIMLTIIDNQS